MNESQIPSDLSDVASSDAELKDLVDDAVRPRSRTNVDLESETTETRRLKTAVTKKRDKVFKEPIKAPRTRRPRPQPGRRLDFGIQAAVKVTLKIELSGRDDRACIFVYILFFFVLCIQNIVLLILQTYSRTIYIRYFRLKIFQIFQTFELIFQNLRES